MPGNGGTDEVILVGTHYDSGMFTGAVDNNATVALMIEWAKYFAFRPQKERYRDMIFAWCFGHDFDNNTGHYQFAEAHTEKLKKAIVWDADHAAGGIRYVWDEKKGTIVPTSETNEFYIMSNNYTFTRLAAFTMDKYGFVCTQKPFTSAALGPQWGIAPDTSPWVNVASIPIYYHSMHDTPDKIRPGSDKVRLFGAYRNSEKYRPYTGRISFLRQHKQQLAQYSSSGKNRDIVRHGEGGR